MIQSDKFDSAHMNIKEIANSISIFLFKRLIEIFGIIVFLLGILLFIALISYSPTDPNFIYAENTEIKNILGFQGSYTSDIFFQSIGLISLLIPFTFVLTGINIFRQKKSLKWLVGALGAAINSTLIMHSSTGVLLVLVMLGLFGLQTMRGMKFVAVITITCGVIFGGYMSIDRFKRELDESIGFGMKILIGEDVDQNQLVSSTGERYQFASNGAKLFLQCPLIGYGTGSVEQQYDNFISGTDFKRTTNLHNEYLMIGVQSGAIGIFLLIGTIFAFLFNFGFKFKLAARYFSK